MQRFRGRSRTHAPSKSQDPITDGSTDLRPACGEPMVERPIDLRSYEYAALRDRLSPLARNRAAALSVSRAGNRGQITHISRGAAEDLQNDR